MNRTFTQCATGAIFVFVTLLLGVAGGPQQHPFLEFTIYALATAILYGIVFYRSTKRPSLACDRSTRPSTDILFSTKAIVLIAILLRVAFLIYPPSSEINRRLWEGDLQRAGINPYTYPPFAGYDHFRSNPAYIAIQDKDVPSLDPPLTLLLFRGLASLTDHMGLTAVDRILFCKSIIALLDLGAVLVLVSLLRIWNKPQHWLAVYAWNPLVLTYGAGEGHIGVAVVLFTTAALVCLQRQNPRFGYGFFLLGCSVMIGYVPIILLPFLMNRRNITKLPWFAAPVLSYGLFWDDGMFNGLWLYTAMMHHNDFIPRLFRSVMPSGIYHALVLIIPLAGFFYLCVMKQEAPTRGMALGWMWLVVCQPTVRPWHLIPLLVFLIHSPSRAWFLLSVLTGLELWGRNCYLRTGAWQDLPWLWSGMYLPFLTLLFRDFLTDRYYFHAALKPPGSIDIMIPTFNEADRIRDVLLYVERAIEAFRTAASQSTMPAIAVDSSGLIPDVRIHIIDGGSNDGTLAIADDFDVNVTALGRASRGGQFREGIARSTGELIVMIHADAIMDDLALINLFRRLGERPQIQWGVLGHRYDWRPWNMRCIEISNRLRFRYLGLAFGDQGIFVRRAVLNSIGGMPDLPLMEDVELSLLLAAYPCRGNIGGNLTVSTRRWVKKTFSGYTMQVMRLCLGYLVRRRFGADKAWLANDIYRRYYRKP